VHKRSVSWRSSSESLSKTILGNKISANIDRIASPGSHITYNESIGLAAEERIRKQMDLTRATMTPSPAASITSVDIREWWGEEEENMLQETQMIGSPKSRRRTITIPPTRIGKNIALSPHKPLRRVSMEGPIIIHSPQAIVENRIRSATDIQFPIDL